MVQFEGNTPILRVASMEASLAYYVKVLGFEVPWQMGYFACVKRGRSSIFLSVGDQGPSAPGSGWA